MAYQEIRSSWNLLDPSMLTELDEGLQWALRNGQGYSGEQNHRMLPGTLAVWEADSVKQRDAALLCSWTSKRKERVWWGGSAGKHMCHQAWWPEFDCKNLHGGRRRAQSCKLPFDLYSGEHASSPTNTCNKKENREESQDSNIMPDLGG